MINLNECVGASGDLERRLCNIAESIAGSRIGGELLIEAMMCGSRHPMVYRFARAAGPIIQARDDIDAALHISGAIKLR